MRPPAIDPQVFPALEQLRQCCTQGGDKLIDRVYAEALKIHRMLRDKENELENAWAALGLKDYPALAEHARQENAMEDLL